MEAAASSGVGAAVLVAGAAANVSSVALAAEAAMMAAAVADDPVTTMFLPYQYLAGFLIGLGNGGVVGSSTIGVAMFSLIAPPGHLYDFTSLVPVVTAVSSLATVSVYIKHAEWALCCRMWPFIAAGIAVGTVILPALSELLVRRCSAIIYGIVLAQRMCERAMEIRAARLQRAIKKHDGDGVKASADDCDNTMRLDIAAKRATRYRSLPVTVVVSTVCGVVTVLTNNSGPILNVFFIACGLQMDAFVASRSLVMMGKNLTKVAVRVSVGGLTWTRFVHGVQVGALSIFGVQAAKPIKRRISMEFYEYFTWCMLLYTCVKMWCLSSASAK
eukprot:NODE_11706_length_1269_cov_19.137478.p1 GENE.NODE_11706_length_1269_cov_19.137478~~NODE_11706_length_1269_cov_19.137478.p1  ORF type:complete len:330 (-),score=72.50 NODE_11706_length_1269_cov_19.137478:179-1168(-)